jgi:hypothetical protein
MAPTVLRQGAVRRLKASSPTAAESWKVRWLVLSGDNTGPPSLRYFKNERGFQAGKGSLGDVPMVGGTRVVASTAQVGPMLELDGFTVVSPAASDFVCVCRSPQNGETSDASLWRKTISQALARSFLAAAAPGAVLLVPEPEPELGPPFGTPSVAALQQLLAAHFGSAAHLSPPEQLEVVELVRDERDPVTLLELCRDEGISVRSAAFSTHGKAIPQMVHRAARDTVNARSGLRIFSRATSKESRAVLPVI